MAEGAPTSEATFRSGHLLCPFPECLGERALGSLPHTGGELSPGDLGAPRLGQSSGVLGQRCLPLPQRHLVWLPGSPDVEWACPPETECGARHPHCPCAPQPGALPQSRPSRTQPLLTHDALRGLDLLPRL